MESLEYLLLPLLPPAKSENPAAYRLAGTVLRRVSPIIQIPISSLVNKVLLGTADTDINDELETHIHLLIFELHKISPDLLTRIIPTLCQQLLVEDEDVRHNAVKLLSRLFYSPHAEFAVDFSRSFRDFLGRIRDVSVPIRLEILDCCGFILKRKRNLLKHVEGLHCYSFYYSN